MSITVPLEGFGGGSNPLNFKVVGGTSAPASPKENTIWVNTDTEITGWFFNATEPEAPAEGMVWISTGTFSSVEFNALKKNGLQVCPISAKQYINGAWVDKTAKSYQDGVWVDWFSVLYDSGDEFEPITGGWAAYYGTTSSYPNKGTLTKNTDNLQITIPNKSNITVHTARKIDLSNYSVAEFDVECISHYDAYTLSCYADNTENYAPGGSAKAASINANIANGTRATICLDISNLSGFYYIGAFAFLHENGSTMKYKVWKVVLK